jgi:hypothetical protein
MDSDNRTDGAPGRQPPRKTIRLSQVERLHGILPPAEALFLLKLIQADGILEHDEDGYFVCTDKYLANAYWKKNTSTQHFQRLAAAGILDVKRGQSLRFGTMPVRLVRINMEEIERRLEVLETGGSDSQSPRIIIRGYGEQSNTYGITEKTNSRPNGAAPRIGTTQKGESMIGAGLFPAMYGQTSNAKSLLPTKEDYADANKLHDAVASRANIRRRWSLIKWAKEISLLRGEVGSERLAPALAWYTAHIGGEYIPESYCAKSFRDKFLRIESAMKRDAKQNPQVTISPATESAVRRLHRLTWPKGSRIQVSTLVQASADAIKALRTRLSKHAGNLERADGALYRHLSDPDFHAEQWAARVHARICNWPEFNGKLAPFVWSLNRAECQADLCEVVERRFGSRKPFDVFLKEYNLASQNS